MMTLRATTGPSTQGTSAAGPARTAADTSGAGSPSAGGSASASRTPSSTPGRTHSAPARTHAAKAPAAPTPTRPHRTASSTPSSTPSKSTSASPSHSASASPSQSAGGGSSSTPTAAPTPVSSAAVAQVLELINKARAQQGLSPLTISTGLTTSATRHTMTMAGGCGLSHQCPGEAGLGDRETAAGVKWGAAGENIGEGGPVDNTSAAIARMAVGLTQGMLDEKPPNDGHRKNILSSSYSHIGISVYRDAKGTVWLTQDFSD
ncbi:hypothetical protein BIV57_18515 [Mangrovactinospora gilvigrisea]|uniref:SCP domain-containing protein n=2 Tax=Mangrovactinospora gilvigrisea TaxID=1428644 RepID=A0A1J7BBG7_9ACTN|nr:hypothetical protein BIV57_18515 [Mangrovactinospora gilvigrisea]